MKLDYNRIDAELITAIDLMPPLNIGRDPITNIRESLNKPASPLPAGVTVEVQAVAVPSGSVDVYIYRKSGRSEQPALLWMHGGGYVLGTAAQDLRAAVIADHCDCTVFSVDYSLAPEHPFPAAINECYEVLRWLMQGGESLGIDKHRVAVGGASAGAGLAAGLALLNRDRENVALRMQLLLYPMIDNLHRTPSGQYENHPIWNRAASLNAWEMYLDGTPGENASPYAAASRAEDLAGLPPSYVCVGTEDLFRDEDIRYAQRLVEAGVPCELAVFPGLYHGADGLVPNAGVSQRLKRSFLASLADALE